jgi:hypothetical protein
MDWFVILCVVAYVLVPAQSGHGARCSLAKTPSCEPSRASVSRGRDFQPLQVRVMDEELDHFKRQDLRLYAASLGFVIDRRKSSRGSTVMRRGSEKIIVTRKPDGVFMWWCPHDGKGGTVIDLAQRETGLNLGGLRRVLRDFTNTAFPAVVFTQLGSAAKDLAAVQRRCAKMPVADRHAYLEKRGIPEATLTSERFAGTVKVDGHGAAIFPHRDAAGKLTGYEIKNEAPGGGSFTGFAPGGRKGVWLSNTHPDDLRLVICESAIDALSHAMLFDVPRARYGSIAGKPTAAQHAAVQAAILAMPANSEIVAATDADDSGRKLAELIRTIVNECGRDDLTFRRDEPEEKDWNDVLKKRRRTTPLPHRLGEPSVA